MRHFGHQVVYSAICSFFGFFKSSTAKTPARILTPNTLQDAVPNKDVPFAGAKPKVKLFTPFCTKKTPFWGPFSTGLRNYFRSKTPLTLDMYYVNDT